MNAQERAKSGSERFCRNVKILRERKGLSVKELSELSGVSEYMITNFEKGIISKRANAFHVFKLCDAFEIEVDKIFL